MKMKYGVNTLVWCLPFTLKHMNLIEKVGGFGFDVIELTPVDEYKKLDPKNIREELARNQLDVCLSASFSGETDISHQDSSVREKGIGFIKDFIDWADKIGARMIGGPLYSELGKKRHLPPGERKAERDRSVESLKLIGDYAAQKGITIAIEPLNRFETDMINIAEQALEMCERVDNPVVKMMLDTFHMNIEEKKLGDAIRASAKHLVHFHTCCNDRGIPGSGHIPWDEVIRALHDINYRGYGVIESFDMGEVGAQTMIWRPLAPSLDDIAREGLRFLKEHFA
jgi:D-psicose/D-tagatose/L-ribulose 3-epimerase